MQILEEKWLCTCVPQANTCKWLIIPIWLYMFVQCKYWKSQSSHPFMSCVLVTLNTSAISLLVNKWALSVESYNTPIVMFYLTYYRMTWQVNTPVSCYTCCQMKIQMMGKTRRRIPGYMHSGKVFTCSYFQVFKVIFKDSVLVLILQNCWILIFIYLFSLLLQILEGVLCHY